jgi:ribosomal protein L31|tara:strand:+ start:4932 stop:5237 length:306 start_codon:yes stop_codon:yes gene_type:complete
MAKIIVRNSDNKVVYCLADSQIITMTSDECKFTHTHDDRNTIVLDINSSTHTVYEGVTAPTSFYGNCFTYIDGNWALDADKVTKLNEVRTLMNQPTINPQL